MSEDNETAMMPPPPTGFQSASSYLKTQNTDIPSKHAPSTSSLRNASGGQPPIPNLPGPSSEKPSNGNSTTVPSTSISGNAQAGPSSGSSRPINRPAASKNSIIYSSVQRRNPVLGSIRNVGVEIGDIVADYQVGAHNGVLFLSLKYHRLHPEYIHTRIEKMKGNYNLRIILVLCDVAEHQQSLREINKIAIINEYTVFVAWSNEEIAQYLVCFKSFEHKSADSLKERVQQTYHDQLQHVLTSGRKVNKTDADNLAAQFGSFANLSRQPSKILSNVKGLGATKVTSLVDAFNKPFLVGGLRKQDKDAETGIVNVAEKDRQAVGTARPIYDREDRGEEDVQDEEGPGSPDWPDEEEETAESARTRKRVDSPDRSPGLSPEPRILPDERVWQDPLDDDDGDGDGGDDEEMPSSKRSRIE
ncbi:uncharacterized protein I303_106421 [Kwoniella dejecticola CBS 10117]|uniref:DNA excision repair protein ERCC-1 n=1 Tax=Kwoniella dejecticola CBS 10117 TaxID=1296121 RepID=A0A1A5ZUR8_9TREE|nr:DNA excision repair protein ERCC-1 [Kwoniella dejecticola CBS 10117]OBR81550.1 DNA excision repair protein ERCC-1 [Kwoniella dejecticola CBS 10117]